MACRNICARYESPVVPHMHSGTHEELRKKHPGLARCSQCDIYIIWPKRFCPCCGKPLRTKAHNTNSRHTRNRNAHREAP